VIQFRLRLKMLNDNNKATQNFFFYYYFYPERKNRLGGFVIL
jgi:hypothetical protein